MTQRQKTKWVWLFALIAVAYVLAAWAFYNMGLRGDIFYIPSVLASFVCFAANIWVITRDTVESKTDGR